MVWQGRSGMATYEGKRLAILNGAVDDGDAEVKVSWGTIPSNGDPQSTVLPRISSLRNINAGDPLRYNASQNSGAGACPTVDEISFVKGNTDRESLTSTHGADGELSIADYATDGPVARLILTTRTGQTVTDFTASITAVFAGERLDGPPGVTGH